MLNNIFFWQEQIWDRVCTDANNLPHAMLLAGAEGIGKMRFAESLVAQLLCEESKAVGKQRYMACGTCPSCVWLRSGNHPDFRRIQPADSESQDLEKGDGDAGKLSRPVDGKILVGQIRALMDFVFVGSHRHGNRVAMIAPAEAMNVAAANSLLKILEEPPVGVYFILVSNTFRKVIPTIRSRCRIISFSRPDPPSAERWLAESGVILGEDLLSLAGGAPLLAAEWSEQGREKAYRSAVSALIDEPEDSIAVATRWNALLGKPGFGLTQLVDALQKWIFDLALMKLTGGVRYHVSFRASIKTISGRASKFEIISCYRDLLKIRAVATHPLNTQLFLEDMASRCLKCVPAVAFG